MSPSYNTAHVAAISSSTEELTLEGSGGAGTARSGDSATPVQAPSSATASNVAAAIADPKLDEQIDEWLRAETSTTVGHPLPHTICLYVVNPFGFGSEAHHSMLARLATQAIMRAYNALLNQLDVRRRPQLQLELVSLQSLYDYSAFASDALHEDRRQSCGGERRRRADFTRASAHDCLRRVAFSVYSQSRYA